MDIFCLPDEIDRSKYVVAKYWLKGETNLHDAAWNVAVGQSIGNPGVRNAWETDDLIENACAKIIGDAEDLHAFREGMVEIAFPLANIDLVEDGVSQLLCFLMGGHLDIDSIQKCRLLDVDFSRVPHLPPRTGISGIRKFTGVWDKPLLGGIVKPKTGMSPSNLLDNVKAMIEGGVNFIKEDEILGNPLCCRFEDRLKLLAPYLRDKKVIYCFCINGDYPHVINRAKMVAAEGGNGVHANVWCGLGIYKALRELDLPLWIHFQKSGDKILTDSAHRFRIAFPVICKLASLSGVDSMHCGMTGAGYSSSDDAELRICLDLLRKGNVLPALSCGFHPGLARKVTGLVGPDYLANVGGAIHGHPGGTYAGARAMSQAIAGDLDGVEYKAAIAKWGLVE